MNDFYERNVKLSKINKGIAYKTYRTLFYNSVILQKIAFISWVEIQINVETALPSNWDKNYLYENIVMVKIYHGTIF